MENPAEPRDAHSDPDRIQSRLLNLFFRQSLVSVAGGTLIACLLVTVLWGQAPAAALLCWAAAMTGAHGVRGGLIWYRRVVGAERHTPALWHALALGSTGLSGMAWGTLALIHPMLHSQPHQTLLLLTLLGASAGAATLLAGLRGAVQLFGMGALLPVTVVLAVRGEAVYGWLALCVLLYLGCVMVVLPARVLRYLREMHANGVLRDGSLMRLEDAERMTGVGHFEWDVASGRVIPSAQLCRMVDLSPHERLTVRTLLKHLAAEDRRAVRTRWVQALRARQTEFAHEARVCTPRGLMDVSMAHRVVYDGTGQVQRGLTAVQDISARKADQRELQTLAFHDPLTGLANRKLFQNRLSSLVDAPAGDVTLRAPLALLMLDLDHFKTVNDTLGHAVGDRLLEAAADRLRACVRADDTVARLGGDEFAIIVPDLPSGIDAAELAARINQTLSSPFLLDQQEIYVSCSVGIALYPEDAQGADLLLRCADMALFDAKAKGRSGFQFHTPEQTEQARARVSLEADLRRALERREFELHYQAKVDMTDGRLVGAEALLRWRQRERGLVPPDHFIRLAEDTGLIVPIGEWVLREACATARAWNEGRSAHETLKIAVNLSPRQFWAPNLLTMVCNVMVETGCRPEWIELEITESLLLDSRGHVAEVLVDLREMGFTLAIDDFGTGYSALSYLTRFPIGTLKIDRSFVNEVASHPEREAIVRAIVSMGHSLHLDLVAEGVETEAQAQVLQSLGCHLAQGWLYGRPMAREAFEAAQALIVLVPASPAHRQPLIA